MSGMRTSENAGTPLRGRGICSNPGERRLERDSAGLTRRGPDIEFAIARLRVNFFELLLVERAVSQRAEALLDLRPAARARERAGDGRLSEHPRDRHLREALPTLPGNFVERAHVGEIAFAEHRLPERLVVNPPRKLWDSVQVFRCQ